MLTLNDLQEALPPALKGAASQTLLDKVNQASQDPEYAQIIRENFISYSCVLREGRFKVEDYLNACAYVSFKLMGYTNQESYKRAFPGRYAQLVSAGRDAKEISAYVSNYNKNKLVGLIMEQTVIPAWVMNQDVYQKAINVQLELMTSANSEKVRVEAANSILTHLKRPETKKVELDIGVSENSGLNELKEAMGKLAEQQLLLIQSGARTRDVAHRPIMQKDDDDIIDVTPKAP